MSQQALKKELKQVMEDIGGKAIRNKFANQLKHIFKIDAAKTAEQIMETRKKLSKDPTLKPETAEEWQKTSQPYSEPVFKGKEKEVDDFVGKLVKELIPILKKHPQVKVLSRDIDPFFKIAVDPNKPDGKKGTAPYDVLSDAKTEATEIVFANNKNLAKLFGGASGYQASHVGHVVGVVNLRGNVANNALSSQTTDSNLYGEDAALVNELKAVGQKRFNEVLAAQSTKKTKVPLEFGAGVYKNASIQGGVLEGITQIKSELQGQFFNDTMQANLAIGSPYSEQDIGRWIKEAFDAAQEAIWDHYKKLGAEYQFNKEGSPSMRQDLIGLFLNTTYVKKASKRKGTKKKIKKYNKNPKKTRPQPVTESMDIELGVIHHTKTDSFISPDVKTPASRGRKPATESQNGAASLHALINAQLPQTVAKNMGPPALSNQTGRFASSVRVTDVNQTAKGFPSIGYTYEKNPYQVFEMGGGDPRWATPQRDPRKLIDVSIREIATQHAIGRFYTRRV